ncbi:MAG: hypothetical protein JNN27_00495 [Planctomycetes bacterium]|nr:hypothetical protein [Planctomycetota bacterium]
MGSSDLRLDKAALFDALGYVPHAGQLPIHRSSARFRVVSCGVRFGKTTAAAFECIAELMAPREESMGWVVAPTYDLSERIYGRVLSVVRKRLPHRIKLVSERDRRLVLVNVGGGVSELRAKSADNPDSLLGEGLDFLVVDEATRLDESVWHERLAQRLLDKRGRALLISSPAGWDWFARLHRRGLKGRDVEYASFSGPSWANPKLDRALIEQERARMSADAFSALYGGEFVGEPPFPCDLCHGPDPQATGVVLLNEDEPLASCAECGKPVDRSGRSLVRRETNGLPSLEVIRLYVGDRVPERVKPGAGKRGAPVRIEREWKEDVHGGGAGAPLGPPGRRAGSCPTIGQLVDPSPALTHNPANAVRE